MRNFSPYDQRGRAVIALKEISCNNNFASKPAALYFNHNLSPQRENRPNPMICSKDQSSLHQMTLKEAKESAEVRGEDGEYKEAYFFANNSINYVKFMHRVLKFIEGPTGVDLSRLAASITREMFREMDRLRELLEGAS
jgi:hypothetical protein